MIALLFLFQGLLFIKWGEGTIPEGPYHNLITYGFLFFVMGVGATIDLARYLVQIRQQLEIANKKVR